MKALVTGFFAFGGHEVNPSQLVAERLADVAEIAVLPVSYARAAGVLRDAVEASGPDVVVCFGQADGRAHVSVERVALNLDDARAADEDGLARAGAIRADGPVGRWSTLPVDEIVAALRAGGIPAAPSRDAGGFVCNHVFFELMELLEGRPGAAGGFVHLPLLPVQALGEPVPTMELATMERAARIVLDVVEHGRPPGADRPAAGPAVRAG